MTQSANEIQMDPRQIDYFGSSAQPTGVRDMAGFFRFFQQFAETLKNILTGFRESMLSVRRLHQAGDVKLAIRKVQDPPDLNQMPGYVPWIPGYVLNKTDYPALYAIIGSADPADSPSVTTFTLPDHENGIIRIGAITENPTNKATNEIQPYASGTGPTVIVVSAWLKT